MIKGISMTLGEQEYIVPPLTLGALEDLQESLEAFTGDTSPAAIKTVIDATTRALRRNYPDITRDQVRECIGLENMAEVMEAVMDVSGLKRKAREAGEVPPGQ
jgi:hypothetical protein